MSFSGGKKNSKKRRTADSVEEEEEPPYEDLLHWSRPLSPIATESECTDTRRHQRYYIEDGNIVLLVSRMYIKTATDWRLLQVDNCLFKIHIYFLKRESKIFLDMF